MTFSDYKYSTILLILVVIFIVLTLIAFFVNKFSLDTYYESNSVAFTFMLVFCLSALITTMFLPVTVGQDILKYNKNAYQNAISSEYTVYVDGTVVDGTKLEIDYYHMTIDEEKNEVYLSPRN